MSAVKIAIDGVFMDGVQIPTMTTIHRSSLASRKGDVGYNTDTNDIEQFDGKVWRAFGSINTAKTPAELLDEKNDRRGAIAAQKALAKMVRKDENESP